MSFAHVEDLARALLYEGFVLYPYRASSLKNRQRFSFGVLSPRAFAEPVGGAERWRCRTEALLLGEDRAWVFGEVRFLRVADGGAGEAREVALPLPKIELAALRASPLAEELTLEATVDETGRAFSALSLRTEISIDRLERHLHRLNVEVQNVTPVALDDAATTGRPSRETRREMVCRSPASVHVFLGVRAATESPPSERRATADEGRDPSAPSAERAGGLAEFVSLLEPPDGFAGHAAECRSEGVFPVLVGSRNRRDTVLASPVIVYDYPRLAPESPGDFFDGTEIDEMLALRVLTLSDDEKATLRAQGGPAAEILERTLAMDPAALSALHGRLAKHAPTSTQVQGGAIVQGDRVRIAPVGRNDVMDIALAGRAATVESIELDVDGGLLVTVTVDDDPGKDLGRAGWPGHRFFFRPEELRRIS